MEQISPNVQNNGIGNPAGKPITGAQPFQKCLYTIFIDMKKILSRGGEVTAAAAATKSLADEAPKSANSQDYSDKCYDSQRAKRQRLGVH